MVTHWGMSERLGPVSYKLAEEHPFLGREIHEQRQFSEATMEMIDEEVARILHEASDRASSLLAAQRGRLDKLTQALLNKEEMNEQEIAQILGPSIHAKSNGHAGPKSADLEPVKGAEPA